MYKIMIIDDNHISVDGICHNIGWSDLNAEVVCKAYDGQQALNYLQNNPVDLIISDIEMPQLDGLSLAENALKLNSSIKIILISAFDKFEYAKQAIRLGAFDYIEKPLDYAGIFYGYPCRCKNAFDYIEKPLDYAYLEEIIRNALDMLDKEQKNLAILKKSRPIMVDNFFHKLIQSSSDEARYTLSDYANYLQLNLEYHYYQAIVIRIQNAVEIKEKNGIEEYHIKLMSMSDTIRELFDKNFALVHTLSTFDEIVLLLGHNYSNSKYFYSTSYGLLTELIQMYKHHLFEVNIGIGSIVKYLWSLSSSYSNALKSLEYRFFFPQKDIFTISDTVDKDYTVELYEVSGNEELIQLLCKNDLGGVKKWILSFSEELTQSYKNKQFIFLRVYQLLGHLLKFLCDMGLNINDMEKDIVKTYQQLDAFSTSTEIFQWLFHLCQTISDEMNLSTQSHQEHVCAATLEYIQQHYPENTLCLNEIAENVHISPAHLSALFKKQRQQNISDVITDIRIEAACSLLKNTSLPLKEISAKVGYSNQYYFSSCFKKKTGKTPSSYR